MVRLYGVSTSSSFSGSGAGISLSGLTLINQSIILTRNGNGQESNNNIISIQDNSAAGFNISVVASPKLISNIAATWTFIGELYKGVNNSDIELLIATSTCISHNSLFPLEISLAPNTSLGGLRITCANYTQYNSINWSANVVLTEV